MSCKTFCFQRPVDSDGRGKARAQCQDEEDGGRNGTGVWDESQGEEAKVEGLRSWRMYLACLSV